MELVILAAGLGSRYGGLKQIDPVGPGGETMLDYAVFDAARAGFSRIVFVIRREFEAVFREQVGGRAARALEVAYAFQELTDLPGDPAARSAVVAARAKPWGTGHAVWCARRAVQEPFAVLNADDFYGADSFIQLARFLAIPRPGHYAMIGFRLAQTLSEHGAVSRGLAVVTGDRLRLLEERTGIRPEEVGPGRAYSGQEIVSMNCWAFTPDIFPHLEEELSDFLHLRGSDPKAEFYLPAAVSNLIGAGDAQVTVLPTLARWFGVTYREDRPKVVAELAAVVAAGAYPTPLFP